MKVQQSRHTQKTKPNAEVKHKSNKCNNGRILVSTAILYTLCARARMYVQDLQPK